MTLSFLSDLDEAGTYNIKLGYDMLRGEIIISETRVDIEDEEDDKFSCVGIVSEFDEDKILILNQVIPFLTECRNDLIIKNSEE